MIRWKIKMEWFQRNGAIIRWRKDEDFQRMKRSSDGERWRYFREIK
jgi:hypothetical protein